MRQFSMVEGFLSGRFLDRGAHKWTMYYRVDVGLPWWGCLFSLPSPIRDQHGQYCWN